QVADMEPGDAIFIPPLWWHHVESLEPLNMLVNYWWKGNPLEPSVLPSALDSLLHAIVGLRSLSPGEREAWRAIFEYYVFGDTQAAAGHIPEARRGVLGDMSPEFRKSVRDFLVEQLKR